MDEDIGRGHLAATPFPRLLFRFWEQRSSGQLTIQGDGTEKALYFKKGDLTLAEGFFSEDGFQRKLISARIIGIMQAEDCASYAHAGKMSFPRALIERDLFSARQVWEMLTDFWLEDVGTVFDWPQAEFIFDPDREISEAQVFASISTLRFIITGVRRMKNFGLIEAWLPAEAESIQALSPAHADLVPLAPHEKHILDILRQSIRLSDLYALSQAGKRETQRVIFALLFLDLAGLSLPRSKPKPPAELSSAGLEKIWGDFNDKCSFIYKYISKEIGPVALSVLEKALDEVRSRLEPPFQGLELVADGRVEFKPFPLMSLNLFTEESRKNFIRVLNEILAAEVLAVKKTLGNPHEALVVKNLDRIGEPI
jgi:hypothetical protein